MNSFLCIVTNQSRIDEFLKTVERYAVAMATNNVLIPMGCDFTFFNAAIMYKNIDKVSLQCNPPTPPPDVTVHIHFFVVQTLNSMALRNVAAHPLPQPRRPRERLLLHPGDVH
jgi:hypothetical protein